MVEGKDEENFDFTREGKVFGYISLDHVEVLAARTARETAGPYGSNYVDVPMAFEGVESDETEGHCRITLSFRPEGAFARTPGREQFFKERELDPRGIDRLRQVLDTTEELGFKRT